MCSETSLLQEANDWHPLSSTAQGHDQKDTVHFNLLVCKPLGLFRASGGWDYGAFEEVGHEWTVMKMSLEDIRRFSCL